MTHGNLLDTPGNMVYNRYMENPTKRTCPLCGAKAPRGRTFHASCAKRKARQTMEGRRK